MARGCSTLLFRPAVSVLIPCYNAEQFVGLTLTSLRRQTFENWECVVVDDGSTDESAGAVHAHAAQDSRIKMIRQANGGVSRARNAAYAASRAESAYLLFLDSDDYLEPTMLEVLVSHLERYPGVGLVYSAFAWVGKDNDLIPPNDPRLPDFLPTRYVPAAFGPRVLQPGVAETPFASIFSSWAGLLPSNSLFRRSVYATTPGWDESLGQPAEDTDMFLHMALRATVHYLPHVLVRYRRHATQSTIDRARILTQDRKLFWKWRQRKDLTSRELAVVREARWFREARVLPYLSLRIGASHLRNGNLAEAMKCVLRAARQFAIAPRIHIVARGLTSC
jgi:glycosyltransferase involved in cell wall biosynthesis